MVDERNTSEQLGVELEEVTKRFGSTMAVDDVSFDLEPGRIHAFVGKNGAGKSTCLGLIAGRLAPTSGTVAVNGHRYARNITPAEAQEFGVAAIYQELTIVPAMTVLDNAFLGHVDHKGGIVATAPMRRRFLEMCDRLDVEFDPSERAGNLSLASQQMLEIIRALLLDSSILLLDEPTSALAPKERQSLFSALYTLRDAGVCLVFVTHYLDEVLEISDDVLVFRDGLIVAHRAVKEWTESSLIHAMLGRRLEEVIQHQPPQDAEESPVQNVTPQRDAKEGEVKPLLKVSNLSVGKIEGLSMHAHAGEIVGLAGLVGSGRSTLVRALAGAQPAQEGRIWFDGKQIRLPRNPRDSWKRGISMIPEDRKSQGLVLSMTAWENIALGDLRARSRFGVLSESALREEITEIAAEFGLPAWMLKQPTRELSGGNQQKVVFARWKFRPLRVLLADEATRGIDVGAKVEIMETLRGLAEEGLAVIFISSEFEEVLAVSDRIYVLHDGRVQREFEDTEGLGQTDILDAAFGAGERR